MAIHERRLFLLAYDIADPKRLQQIHRAVRSVGIPVQYSVFLVPGSAMEVDGLLARLDALIQPTQDDVRVYPLPKRLDVQRYGRQQMPVGSDHGGPFDLQDALLSLVGEPGEPGKASSS